MSTKNEKVIFTVLRKISNDRQFIGSAFKSWWADKDQVNFDADDLVAYFENKVGFDANEKRNFRIAFYAISTRSESDLLSVPEVLTGKAGQTTGGSQDLPEVEKVETLKPEEKTFQLFIEALIDHAHRMDSDTKADVIEHFQDSKVLKSMKLAKRPGSQLTTWLENDSGQRLNTETMTVKEMKAIFHQIYICFCEILGPVKADQVLNQAIAQVQQLNTGYSVSALI